MATGNLVVTLHEAKNLIAADSGGIILFLFICLLSLFILKNDKAQVIHIVKYEWEQIILKQKSLRFKNFNFLFQ